MTGNFDNFLINSLSPQYEDLTTYTEVDEDDDISVTERKCDVITMRRDAVSYVYKDLGVDYLGEFEIEFEAELTETTGVGGNTGICLVTNTLPGTIADIAASNDGIEVELWDNNDNLRLSMHDRTDDAKDQYYPGGTSMALTYFKFKRVGSTVTLTAYSDAVRETVIDTLQINGADTGAKRYLYVLMSRDDSVDGAWTQSLYTQNWKIITAG
jgi:hypothetical protein